MFDQSGLSMARLAWGIQRISGRLQHPDAHRFWRNGRDVPQEHNNIHSDGQNIDNIYITNNYTEALKRHGNIFLSQYNDF